MSEPVISVCMITYNHLNFIRHAIEGVLIQKTTFPIELVIADDYSTDGTREIILDYKSKYPGIITLVLQKSNVDVAQNWIDMVETPKSKYIAFCDGDDYWTDPYKLQKQIDFLENNPDYAICFHPAEYLYEDPEPKRIYDLTYEENETTFTEDLIRNDYIPFCSSVMRRDNIKKVPSWFKDLKGMDWPILLLASYGKKIKRLGDKMSVYRVHGNSVWSSKKYSYILANTLVMFECIEKDVPDKYLRQVKNKIFDVLIDLYKAHLTEGNVFSALKIIPEIYSFRHRQGLRNNLMASKIIAVSFIRKFIKKRTIS